MKLSNPVPPFKFKLIKSRMKTAAFSILDVGCGNHSPVFTKKYFPGCIYSGLDRGEYNLSPADHKCMDRFYLVDLEGADALQPVMDRFDVIVCSHVIEHLKNGEKIIAQLAEKLKPGGVIYFEYPAVRSLGFPNLPGTLNFSDDLTHVRLYDLRTLANILLDAGCTIVRAGVKRDWFRMMYGPFSYLAGRVFRNTSNTVGLWDWFGFAEYIFAVKR